MCGYCNDSVAPTSGTQEIAMDFLGVDPMDRKAQPSVVPEKHRAVGVSTGVPRSYETTPP